MNCPNCEKDNKKCIDSRDKGNYRRRRYECLECGDRWSTAEVQIKYFDEIHKLLSRINISQNMNNSMHKYLQNVTSICEQYNSNRPIIKTVREIRNCKKNKR
jgi:transcriptional regulator NrdR family protein